MSVSFSSAPHIEGARPNPHPTHAPNAALLIDFDNVTMGIRSDLSKELKTLLNSDVIRGKVTVQRAYADWRRYPQYIVPLSEASIDLIFAPAYGSNKKNATDFRMAIDGIELVFTRPEIGTYILLTGDSDFSSLVLKLKEYGKYVIGVGIQESSSDILVQNCDEYYSYTSLSGLRKTEEIGKSQSDPWALVERAVEQMGRRGDVMRSDRLKQVILEIDPAFDEKTLGFSKFSKFLNEATRKGLIQTRRMENGQYEILPGKGAGKSRDGERSSSRREQAGERRPSDRGRSRSRQEPAEGKAPEQPAEEDGERAAAAYRLLRSAVSELLEDQESDSVRDSDVKRRMLALDGDFDEGTLGFPKFSRFLRHAHDQGLIDLRREEGGNYQVALGAKELPEGTASPTVTEEEADRSGEPARTTRGAADGAPTSGRLRPREESQRRHDELPPLFEGQVVGRVGAVMGSERVSEGPGGERAARALDAESLHLPTDPESIVSYLTNSYGGVGRRTAETLVETLGDRLFDVLQTDPSRVKEILPPARAEKVLEGWQADFRRRKERHLGPSSETSEAGAESAETARSPVEEAPGSAEPGAGERPRRRGRRTRGGARSAD
jgi:uncharacterized protein (TIGR00288 family)